MEQLIGGGAAGDASAVKNGSTATFMADVIDASRDAAIVVDFWAPWCGPCKQLGPTIEKAVRESRGKVKLVKINVDENQDLAAQMRIQSIPAVYAFKDGRPVDGFVGALPESQVKQFVQRLASAAGAGAAGDAGDPVAEALALAKEAAAAGDHARATNIYMQVVQHEPGNVEALAALSRGATQRKEFAKAKQFLDKVPKEQANHADVAAARAALELAEAGSKAAGAMGQFKTRLDANANDHEARYELASALFAAGQREEAIDQLLDLIRRDRMWNEEAGRKQLLKFFEAIGLTDPLTVASRRKLSALLFA
jgi:putative thioredoxin